MNKAENNIKENYIKIPSVEKIEKILNEFLYEMPQAKYKYHLENIKKLAKNIIKELGGK